MTVPSDGRDALLAYVARQQSVMTATLSGVRAKDGDAVHEMRIAVRRIRATLGTFGPVFDHARAEWLRIELKWLDELLGAVRDTDIMFARIEFAIATDAATAPLVEPVGVRIRKQLRASARTAHAALATALSGARYRRLTDALASFVASRLRAITLPKLHRLAATPLQRADRLLDRAGTDPESLHEARRVYKHARYAIEVLVPIDGDSARSLAKRIADLTEVLGVHQDAMVTAELLRAHGEHADEHAFAYGLLYGRQLAAADLALTGLDRARRRAGPELRVFL